MSPPPAASHVLSDDARLTVTSVLGGAQEPLKWVPGQQAACGSFLVQVLFLDKVVDEPVVSHLQCVDKVVAVPVVLVVRSPAPVVETVVSHSCSSLRMRLPSSQFFDKAVDMPVVAPLQHVDKMAISLLCRSCSFQGARRGEDSPIPPLPNAEKIVEIPEVQYSDDGRCPCDAGRARFPGASRGGDSRLPQLRR